MDRPPQSRNRHRQRRSTGPAPRPVRLVAAASQRRARSAHSEALFARGSIVRYADVVAITFRVATDEDRIWSAELMASSEPWLSLKRSLPLCREIVSNPRNDVIVSCEDAASAAFAVVDRHGLAGAPYLKSIAVTPDRRSRGLGTALLQHVESEFGRPAGNMFLCVSSFNHRARALYERLGYTIVGELADFLISGQSELILRKRLPRPGTG